MGDDLDMARSLADLLRFDPATGDLAAIDPRGTPGLPKAAREDPKVWARAQLPILGGELFAEQEKLVAAAKTAGSRQRVLLLIQAMDCGGKDGTIKHVVGEFNPQGVQIVAFGKPTEEELAHDFLWRIEKALPGPGQVGVFNRSHYEDVLTVRVNSLVPARTWRARYNKINKFEAAVVGSGCELIKVMLHISYAEQRGRLSDRLQDPTKYWKYNPSDLDERRKWPAYQDAYNDALVKCSTDAAPWYVVPADRKWYRDWAVATLLLERFRALGLAYPPPDFDLDVERERLAQEAKVNGT